MFINFSKYVNLLEKNPKQNSKGFVRGSKNLITDITQKIKDKKKISKNKTHGFCFLVWKRSPSGAHHTKPSKNLPRVFTRSPGQSLDTLSK